MENFFSINTVFFTVLNYPMSYIEFIGTIFNLLCVWLASRRNIWTWPTGLVAIILYFFLFYQIRLYSDLIEQIYFFIMTFYGWWLWSQGKNKDTQQVKVEKNSPIVNSIYLVSIVILTVALGYIMQHIHLYLPKVFLEPATYPYLDAFTTILSFAATILLAQKKFEAWYLWILVDIIGIWLYYVKGVKFIALEYAIFLGIAIHGFLIWRSKLLAQKTINS